MVKRMIALHLIGLLAAITIQLQAQTLSGTVTDSESHQPLEGVMISVTRGNITIDYTLTAVSYTHLTLPTKRIV